MSDLVARIEALAEPVLAAEGVELVDLTYQREPSGWTLCFYLDKSGGITLDDCQAWSERLGNLLEVNHVLEIHFNLEVSSPGLNRALKKTKDFERYAGQQIHVRLFAPIDGQKNFHGSLIGVDETTLRLKNEEERDVTLPRSMIAKCRLDPKIDF